MGRVQMDHMFIGSLFEPVQLSETIPDEAVFHRTMTPPVELSGYIQSIWEMKVRTSANELCEFELIPDGSVDLLFSLNASDTVSYLSVTDSKACTLFLPDSVHYIGVRFRPGAFLHFFPFSFISLKGQTLPLNEVFGAWIQEWEHKILEAGSVEKAVSVLCDLLKRQLSMSTFSSDPRFLQSLYDVLQSNGSSKIEREVASMASPRNLRRIFEQNTGLSPKSFSRIVRFQKMLESLRSFSQTEASLPIPDFGYFDQAHLIKDCKLMTGKTPVQLIRQLKLSDFYNEA